MSRAHGCVGPQYRRPCGDQADTCTLSEKSGTKIIQPNARDQGPTPNRFVRVADVSGDWNLAELTDGKEQYWACQRDSVRIQMPSGLDGVVNLFLFLVE